MTPVERSVPPNAEIVTAYTDGKVTKRSLRSKVGYHEAADLSSYQGVEPGDFVVHGLDILRGSVGVSDSQGAMSAVCTVCRPARNVDGRYIAYAIRLQAQSGFTRALARGVREGGADFRRWDTLATLPVPVRPLDDQRRIADFLDDQVARIDNIVAARQKQKSLLGRSCLDILVDVARADGAIGLSPLPWFRAWREGWQVQKLAWLVRCLDGRRVPLNATERETRSGPYPYYGASTLVDYVDDFLFDGDYVLIGEDGAALENPEFDVVQRVSGRFWVNNHAHVLQAIHINLDYLAAYLRCVDRFELISGATRAKITQEDLMRIPVVVPGESEQTRLAMMCRSRLREVASALRELTRGIDLLAELKRSLITAAVTGEFDVTTADGSQLPV